MHEEGSRRGGLFAVTAAAFAREDEERSQLLDRLIAEEKAKREREAAANDGRCPRGHRDWGLKTNGRSLARYCKACRRMDYVNDKRRAKP